MEKVFYPGSHFLFTAVILFIVLYSNTPAQDYALSFNGTNQYITTNLDAQPSALPTTTWEAWIKTSNVAKGTYQAIFSTDNGGWDRGVWIPGDDRIVIGYGTEGWIPSGVTLNADTWYHIAVVYKSDNVLFYLNGIEYSLGASPSGQSTSVTFSIGANADGAYFFEGDIDEVRVWNTARSQADIQNNMNTELTGTESNLAAYYRMNEGSGTTISDNSGHGYTGTLINSPTWITGKFQPAGLSQMVIYVDASRTSGGNIGSVWSNAYTSLQSALNAASGGGYQIWAAKGTYKPSYDYGLGGGSRYYHFKMIKNVGLYGGFEGDETSVNQRTNYGDGQTNETIISGDIGTVGDKSDNCYHLFYHPNGLNLDSTAILDGFTIIGGNANGSSFHVAGGGMNNVFSSPSIRNVVFKSNTAGSGGGGIYNLFASPKINNVIFTSNSAKKGGGAMYNQCSFIITNSTFTSNTALDSTDDNGGGGIYVNGASSSSASCTLTNVEFINDSAWTGGGFYGVMPGPIIFNNVKFQNNVSTNTYIMTFGGLSGAGGGGMFLSTGSSAVFDHVTFDSNCALSSGGGASLGTDNNTVITFKNSIFTSNSAAGLGGGISITNPGDLSNFIITNCLFANNYPKSVNREKALMTVNRKKEI